MIPYHKISSRLIKPHNLYTYDPSVEEYFFGRFGQDEKSFDFLHYLIRYCCENNEGEWPDKITNEIISEMSKDAGYPILIEETKLFADGFVSKDPYNKYDLTHEFIVSAFMCCTDGNFLPLSTGHIDFSGEDKIANFLRDEIFIKEPQAVTFLVKIVVDNVKTPGVLMGREMKLSRVFQIAQENDLIFDLCIEWARSNNLLFVDIERDVVICNSLMLTAYAASPKL